jgi:ESCRT-II complex subunit VPS36
MFFKALDLTTALRPLLLPDETLLFVQDAVGLYEGYVAHRGVDAGC